jgi:hypothetical protein
MTTHIRGYFFPFFFIPAPVLEQPLCSLCGQLLVFYEGLQQVALDAPHALKAETTSFRVHRERDLGLLLERERAQLSEDLCSDAVVQ